MELTMNIDPRLFTQLLRAIPYPVSKGDLIEIVRQNGVNENLINDLEALLPDKTFNSANEILELIPSEEG
jgi:hypothetical protein